MSLTIDFCGEIHHLADDVQFSIGRDADLSIDDHQFLHRRFLLLSRQSDFWLLSNIGTQLTATVSDTTGHLEAFLSPGSSLPLIFDVADVSFTAGPTTYSFTVTNSSPAFATVPLQVSDSSGDTTLGATQLTPDQRLLIVALAEPRLRGDGRASVTLPSSVEAAERLGWTITKFNRKLDNVCQKLQRLGVRGLHGGPEKLASNRRSRLVEYAVATRLVSRPDLTTLDVLLDQMSASDGLDDA